MSVYIHISADLGEGHGDTLGVLLQLVEDGVVAELEHQVQLPLPPEHLQASAANSFQKREIK